MNNNLAKYILVLMVALLLAENTQGQSAQRSPIKEFLFHHNDSLHYAQEHPFRWGELAVPVAMMGAGIAIYEIDPLYENTDLRLRDALQADGHASFQIEDYAQYAPIAFVPIFKLCGVESRHGWRDLINLAAGSYLIGSLAQNITKFSVWRERPNGSDLQTSFPSGHTFTAFTGAEILRREYGRDYPIIPIVGYTIATGVGFMRVYNNKHWASDVLAGAGLGILSASVMYWLAPYLRF